MFLASALMLALSVTALAAEPAFRAIPFSIPTEDGLARLTGEIDVPVENKCDTIVKPIPAVVMVPGTGRFDRDVDFGNSASPRDLLFRQIAERIVPKGIAAVRADYRGVHCDIKAKPEGCVDPAARKTVTPATMRSDIKVIYRYAANKIPCIDPQRMAVLAHSEGTIHLGYLIKNKEINPSALVLIGMVAESPKSLIEWQSVERPIARLARSSEAPDRFLSSELKANGLGDLLPPGSSSLSRDELKQKLKEDYEKIRSQAMALPDAEMHENFWTNTWWKMWWSDETRVIDQLAGYPNEIVAHLGDIDDQVPGPREEGIIKKESSRFKVAPKIVMHPGLGHSLGADALVGPIDEGAMKLLVSDLVRVSGLTEKPEEMPPILTGAEMAERPFFGFTFNLYESLPKDKAYQSTDGLRVLAVTPGFPVWRGGVRPNDILLKLNGVELGLVPKNEVLPGFIRNLQALKAGKTATLTVLRWDEDHGEENKKYKVLDLPVEVSLPRKVPTELTLKNDEGGPLPAIATELASHYGFEKDYEELKLRLANVGARPDAFRLQMINALQNHPYAMRSAARALTEGVKPAPDLRFPALNFLKQSRALIRPGDSQAGFEMPPLRTGLSPQQHLAQIKDVLKESNGLWDQAFARLKPEELDYLRDNIQGVLGKFEEWNYLYQEKDEKIAERNGKVIDILTRVDLEPLIRAAIVAERLADPVYVKGLKSDLAKAGLDLRSAEVLTEKTPYGLILIGGIGDGWYQDLAQREVAVLIDLGGNDYYANGAGASSAKVHVSVAVDMGGDNVFESNTDGSIGAGILGVGIVASLGGGNDHYTGVRITEGAGVCGVGLLIDTGGNDVYRAHTYAQGASFYGVGALIDVAGNDRYEAHQYAQGAAIAGGTAALIDLKGDDEYFAKGFFPTGYSTPGTYQGWSQGVGVGVRNFMSGGVGLLVDEGGKDVFEGGDFSQGGGYYFGWGILRTSGDGKRFMGSRYSQGFSAHYSLGTFLGEGSHGYFESRGSVSTGNANDMSVSWFENTGSGNRYPARDFSLGAAANNSISVFVSQGKANRYEGTKTPADSLQNDYHGRASLALFFDLGSAETKMDAAGNYGFVFHTDKSLRQLARGEVLKPMLRPFANP